MQGWTQDKLAVQLLTVTARLQSATLHNNNKYPVPVPCWHVNTAISSGSHFDDCVGGGDDRYRVSAVDVDRYLDNDECGQKAEKLHSVCAAPKLPSGAGRCR